MKIERTNNAIRNVFFGILYKAEGILMPFICRTIMIYYMGTQYVGLNSLFSSILSFLSLAELGIGNALVFSMYKPIAQDDEETLCALLNLYKKVYLVIGTVISVVGIALLPFLRYLVNGDCPADVNIYALYGIYLFNTAISYLMFGYKQSLLVAFQRSDIISKRTMILQFFMNVIQICVICTMKNYYVYIILMPVFTVLSNLYNWFITNKMFPQIVCRGQISKELQRSIIKKVAALLGTKANAVVMHAADNIVISAYLGLTMVGIYGNYYYIMNAIIGVMTIIYSSITAGIGNSLESESIEKNYNDFKVLSFLNLWVVMFCSISLLCLYQPFVKIWVGEERMLGFDSVILLVIYFFVYQIRRIILTYKDAAGIWWEDKFRPYVVMITNIVFNIVSVQIIGINGVIASTIISMIVSIPWENYTVFKHIFGMSSVKYYIQYTQFVLVSCALAALTYGICSFAPGGWLGLFIRAAACCVVPNVIFVLLYCKRYEFKRSLLIVKNQVLKRNNKKLNQQKG